MDDKTKKVIAGVGVVAALATAYGLGVNSGEKEAPRTYSASAVGSVNNSTSSSSNNKATTNTSNTKSESKSYILNTNTKKIHKSGCSAISQMKESNKKSYTGDINDLFDDGYSKCQKCNPK